MGLEPDRERDVGNRFPKPPPMPHDVVSDPVKRKKWDDYWAKVRSDWAEFLKESSYPRTKGKEENEEWIRRNLRENENK